MAVRLAERVRDALARAPLPKPARGGSVRSVDPRNLHLTLKVLGDVEEARIPGLTEALRTASRGVEPFEIEVAGLGVVPARGAPRVVWAGVAGGEPLVRLHRRVEEACGSVGFERDERAYRPHVTLARVRGRVLGPALPDPTARELRRFGTSPVAGTTLFESELRPDGARHAERAFLPCGGSDASSGEG
ncbi:MAG: RNA 2',3'-cyclic phosphodiesterase [Planctomycetota bacterium JB042]